MQTNMKLGYVVEEAPETVSAIELAALKRDRSMLEALREDYEEFEKDIRDREESIIGRIERGAVVDGKAEVVTRRKQNISWLTIVRRELGEKKVLEVKDAWPVTFYKVLHLP
jgi:hypothetical protein